MCVNLWEGECSAGLTPGTVYFQYFICISGRSQSLQKAEVSVLPKCDVSSALVCLLPPCVVSKARAAATTLAR